MTFVAIPPGSFHKGLTAEEVSALRSVFPEGTENRRALEDFLLPQFTDPATVEVSGGFYLGKTEVTQAQWHSVMGADPRHGSEGLPVARGDSLPVMHVQWDEADLFISKLNEAAGGPRYRLPTESEWEYACRSAGREAEWFLTGGEEELASRAWYSGNTPRSTVAEGVGRKRPTAQGLHDMLGNVAEWTADPIPPIEGDPDMTTGRERRAHRGGNASTLAVGCLCSSRGVEIGGFVTLNTGFRVVRVGGGSTSVEQESWGAVKRTR